MGMMINVVEKYLERHGGCLTSDLAAHLVSYFGISSSAARQRIKRTPITVKKLAFLTFPRNVRFIYLSKDYASPLFWCKLIEALNKTNSIYGAALSAIHARGGTIPESHFDIVCGAPKLQKKHIPAKIVLERLLQAELLERKQVEGIGNCIVITQREQYVTPISEIRSRLLSEEIMLSAVSTWARNNGIVSYDRVQTRTLHYAPEVGTTCWDLTAPCYLNGVITRISKTNVVRPAFFVVDLLNSKVTVNCINAFVRKCETIRQLNRVTCLQMFIAAGYTKEARELLKKNGIIAATNKSLFGRDFQSGLDDLREIFHQIIISSNIDIEKLDNILSKFKDIEGASLQVRGTLFEFLAAKMAAYEFRTERIDFNKIYTDNKDTKMTAEADLVIEQGRKLIFVECKGTAPYSTVPHKEFEKWLIKQVPTIYAFTRTNKEWANKNITFEFWATAPLSEQSHNLFNSINTDLKTTRYSLRVRLPDDLSKICDEMGNDNVTTAFKKHFIFRGRQNEGIFSRIESDENKWLSET